MLCNKKKQRTNEKKIVKSIKFVNFTPNLQTLKETIKQAFELESLFLITEDERGLE